MESVSQIGYGKLDKVQRRATKMIQDYKDLSYEERLKRCGLITLTTLEKGEEQRRLNLNL